MRQVKGEMSVCMLGGGRSLLVFQPSSGVIDHEVIHWKSCHGVFEPPASTLT